MKKPILLVLVLLSIASLVFAQDGNELPEVIVVENPGIMPEGIEYDAVGERFLLGSLSQGTIFAVADDGSWEPLIEDEGLISTVGIHIDPATNRLLVANSDRRVFSGGTSLASLAAYDLETGERLFLVDLTELVEGGRHFANDVTVDAEGNAYVTDSFVPAIYKITPDGEASVFIEDDRLITPIFGLNGIDFHPDGYLLAAVAGSGAIFKIPVDDPNEMTEVELAAPSPADGMVFYEGVLYTVNPANKVVALTSEDDWQTATVIGEAELTAAATTAAVRDGEIYVIHAQLSNPAAESYEIVRADFGEMLIEDTDATTEPSN